MSHLIPEVRVNKNGVPVVKHVLADKPESGGTKPIPAPPLPAAPVQPSAPDYDLIVQKNRDFERRSDSVLMSPLDLTAFSDLLEYAAKEDDDGNTRVWSASQFIKYGNVGAAKTLNAYIEEHQSDYSSYEFIFDAWRYGSMAGVFEQGKDYSATPDDMAYFSFVARVFELSEHDVTMSEASDETIREIATIFIASEGKADAEDVAEYWEERGDIDVDSYLEYLAEHSGLRNGVL